MSESLSESFEYLCYGSTASRNILILTESDVFRRQILTTKVGPRTVRVKYMQLTSNCHLRHIYINLHDKENQVM